LNGQGYYPDKLAEQLQAIEGNSKAYLFVGSAKENELGRVQLEERVSKVLDKAPKEEGGS
jgi:hypothetical protein